MFATHNHTSINTVHTFEHTCISKYIYAHACIYTYVHVAYIHPYTHTYIHTYMYVAVTVLLVNIILYQMFSDTTHKVNSVGTVYHELTPQ